MMNSGSADITKASSVLPRKKLVVVGDGACGKTCLLIAFTKNEFPENYVPTVFETYVSEIKLQEQRVQMALWDTAGQEDYELLRPLSYPNTDVLVVCFAINSRDSFENVSQKWIPEVRHHCPKTPIVLVGTKLDLRSEAADDAQANNSSAKSLKLVPQSDGHKMAKQVDAVRYIECSAKTRENILEVFESSARVALGQKKTKRVCSIL